MSVIFKLGVVGIEQNIGGINNLERDVDQAALQLMEKISKVHQANLKKYVHVWESKYRPKGKPHMRDTIREEQRGADFVVITVPTTYAKKENSRPGSKPGHGPHNFADMAEMDTARTFETMAKTDLNNAINRNKVRIVVL